MKIRSVVLLAGLWYAASCTWAAGDDDPKAAAQKLFDAMKAHDAAAAAALFIPGATLASVSADKQVTVMPFEKFVERIGSSKGVWLERMWNPKVEEHGALAEIWGEYDFHLDGKFSHCGIDSFTMVETESGWKIASISFTREVQGCKPSPLDAAGKQ